MNGVNSFDGKGMKIIQDWKLRLCGTVCTCGLCFLLPGWAFEVNYSLYKYSFIHI